nr:apoptosis-associated speck-like protein containing a CARD [Zootoca vivipara]
MAKSARDCLLDSLENLEESELKKLKVKLNEFPVRNGYSNIPRGKLQKADALDLKDLLVSYYTEEYAVQLTAEVLEAINCKDRAEELRAATGNRPLLRNSSNVHFIERHREELIQRTTPVEPVLDKLYGSVLTDEQYQKITAKETNPEKMRELYKLVPSWNLRCKDMLYEALKAKIPYLVEDMEGR